MGMEVGYPLYTFGINKIVFIPMENCFNLASKGTEFLKQIMFESGRKLQINERVQINPSGYQMARCHGTSR
jgi:methyl coenzyme M reductase beta subunit